MKPLAYILSLLVILSGECLGQVLLSGEVSGILRDTLYYVWGDIFVSAGDSLVIEAGAEFEFVGGCEFRVKGVLITVPKGWLAGNKVY
jgi:hypothetical protein